MKEILTLEEYIQEIKEIIPEKDRKFRLDDYEKAYAEYKQLKGRRTPELHKVDLLRSPFFMKTQNVQGFFSQFWLVLSDLNMYLLKEIPEGKFFKKNINLYSRINASVVPKVIMEAGLESAEYYIANWVMDDSVSTWEDDFLLTPSFLKSGDEMLSFKDILGQECLDIGILERRLRREFELRHFSKKSIDKFINDFRKEICMSEIIDNTDTSLNNMSVIFNNGAVRMAPMYDFDFCMGNKSIAGRHFKVGEAEGLKAVLNYYKDDIELMKWLEGIVLKINFEQIISGEFDKRNNDIFNYRQNYVAFWKSKMQIIKDCINLGLNKELV